MYASRERVKGHTSKGELPLRTESKRRDSFVNRGHDHSHSCSTRATAPGYCTAGRGRAPPLAAAALSGAVRVAGTDVDDAR